MRDLKLLGELSEVERILIINTPKVLLSVLLLSSKGADEGIDTMEWFCQILRHIVKVFAHDKCQLASIVFLAPFFELASNDENELADPRVRFCI